MRKAKEMKGPTRGHRKPFGRCVELLTGRYANGNIAVRLSGGQPDRAVGCSNRERC